MALDVFLWIGLDWIRPPQLVYTNRLREQMERHGISEEQIEWTLNQPEHEFRIGEVYRYHRCRRFGDRIVVLICRWKEPEDRWIGLDRAGRLEVPGGDVRQAGSASPLSAALRERATPQLLHNRQPVWCQRGRVAGRRARAPESQPLHNRKLP